MKGFVIDYTIGGVYKHICLLADAEDGTNAAQRLARRFEYQGVTVNTITIIESIESLAAAEDAVQGPTPGTISQVLIFGDEEVSA